MNIRPALPDEVAALGALAWAAKASWGYSASQLEAWRDGLLPSEDSVRLQPTYAADVDGVLAGFYQLDMSEQPPALEHLWVHPSFMRRGLGKALLAHAAELLDRRGAVCMHIDADPNALPFYTACGAVLVGENAAAIDGAPDRVRPQLRLQTPQANR